MTNFLNPPSTRNRYVAAAGQTEFQFSFTEGGVLKSPIVVRTLAVGADTLVVKTVDVDYTLDRDSDKITFLVAPGESVVVDIQRATTRERNVTHDPGSTVTGAVLNKDEEQSFRYKQELEDALNRRMGLTDREDEWDADGLPIGNVGSFTEGRLDQVLNYGDLLQLFGEGLIASIGDAAVFFFDGDGTTTDFTLTAKRGSLAETWQVYKNGVRQYPRVQTGDSGVYTIVSASGVDDVLSFDTAPENGAAIAVMTLSGTVIATLLSNTIDTQHLIDGAVTIAKMFGGVGSAGRMIFFDGNGDASLAVPVASDISDFDAAVRTSRLDQMTAPTAPVNMSSQRLTDLPSPSLDGDAARKSYVDTRRLDQFAAPTNPVSMGSQRLKSLAAPTESDDGATKAYVDNAAGVSIGTPVSISTVDLANGTTGWTNATGKPVMIVVTLDLTTGTTPNSEVTMTLQVKRGAGAWTTVGTMYLDGTAATVLSQQGTLQALMANGDQAKIVTTTFLSAAGVIVSGTAMALLA